ncbi:hypothetical protein [Amycolatopsis sp. NPDC021455]|uniref:hypothetical protein n=1 Tax=Amycolatopsis sp. NPDC021455 TaxID=3154901 RepID=UPI0034114B07
MSTRVFTGLAATIAACSKRPNVALGALDAPNATLGALDAPNATLGRVGRLLSTHRRPIAEPKETDA